MAEVEAPTNDPTIEAGARALYEKAFADSIAALNVEFVPWADLDPDDPDRTCALEQAATVLAAARAAPATPTEPDVLIAIRRHASYMRCPTMGYDNSLPPAEFARTKVSESNARLALAIEIENAEAILRLLDSVGAVPSEPGDPS